MADEMSISARLNAAETLVVDFVAAHHSKFVWISVTIISCFAVMWLGRCWKIWRAQGKYLKPLAQIDDLLKDKAMDEKDTLAIYALKMFFHLKATDNGQHAPSWDVAMEAERQAIQAAEEVYFQRFEAFAYTLLPLGLGCTVLGLVGVMNAPPAQFRAQLATKLFFTFVALFMHVSSVLMLSRWRDKARTLARTAVDRATAIEAGSKATAKETKAA